MAHYYPNFLIRLEGPNLANSGGIIKNFTLISFGIIEESDFDEQEYMSNFMKKKIELGYKLSILKHDWHPTYEITQHLITGDFQDSQLSFSINNDIVYMLHTSSWEGMKGTKSQSLVKLKHILFEIDPDLEIKAYGFVSKKELVSWLESRNPKKAMARLKKGIAYKKRKDKKVFSYFMKSISKVKFDEQIDTPDEFESQKNQGGACMNRFPCCVMCKKSMFGYNVHVMPYCDHCYICSDVCSNKHKCTEDI